MSTDWTEELMSTAGRLFAGDDIWQNPAPTSEERDSLLVRDVVIWLYPTTTWEDLYYDILFSLKFNSIRPQNGGD